MDVHELINRLKHAQSNDQKMDTWEQVKGVAFGRIHGALFTHALAQVMNRVEMLLIGKYFVKSHFCSEQRPSLESCQAFIDDCRQMMDDMVTRQVEVTVKGCQNILPVYSLNLAFATADAHAPGRPVMAVMQEIMDQIDWLESV